MRPYTVVVTEPIHHAGVELLREKGVTVIELPPGSGVADVEQVSPLAHALITDGQIEITRRIMISSPRLKVVGVHGVGYDHVDMQAAKELGKVVLNTPTASTETVAELALALLLALIRKIPNADKATRAGEWKRKYTDLIGNELLQKTVGIVGLGRIGSVVARRLKPFEVEIIYYSRTRNEPLEKEVDAKRVSLHELLRKSDVISLHLPHRPETFHLIGREEFELMKDGVLIVNTARGKVLDQVALIEALESGRVAGAALDVFYEEPLASDNPLCSMDNVILTPHIGGSSLEAMERMAIQVADGVLKVLNGEHYEHIVT